MKAPLTIPPTRRLVRAGGILLAALLALAFVARFVFFQGPYQPVADLPDSEIIDLHCHVAGIGAGNSGCFVSRELQSNFRFRIYLQAFGVTLEDLHAQGDTIVVERLAATVRENKNVHRVVLLALDGVVDSEGRLDTNRTQVYVPNEFVAAAAARHTNLLFGASIHPLRSDALERLDEAAAHGAVLVKWIPSIMEIDPADPRMVPFYQRLRHHGLPLLSHTGGERSFTSARDELADPERLRLPLDQGVVVIAAHVGAGGENGGESDFQRVRRLMREYPNLHADISALTQVNRLGMLREALAAEECRGRLVYGSDFPLINTVLVSPWYFPLNLTESERQEIVAMPNPWDRDIRMKQALGVPPEIFRRTAEILAGRLGHRPIKVPPLQAPPGAARAGHPERTPGESPGAPPSR